MTGPMGNMPIHSAVHNLRYTNRWCSLISTAYPHLIQCSTCISNGNKSPEAILALVFQPLTGCLIAPSLPRNYAHEFHSIMLHYSGIRATPQCNYGDLQMANIVRLPWWQIISALIQDISLNNMVISVAGVATLSLAAGNVSRVGILVLGMGCLYSYSIYHGILAFTGWVSPSLMLMISYSLPIPDGCIKLGLFVA